MAANKDESKARATEHLITCSVCLEIYVNPKSLKCLHTFCVRCLENLQDRRKKLIVCPMCKAETLLQRNGVRDLPSDFKIEQMKDLLAKSDLGSSNEGSFCDVCKGKNLKTADFHCAKCSVFYCSNCVEKHNKNQMFRSHHVTNLIAQKTEGSTMCPKHTNHSITFVCLICEPYQNLCAICVLDHKPDHKPLDILHAQEGIRNKLKEHLNKVKQGTMVIQEYISTTDEMKDKYDSVLQAIQEGISKQATQLIEKVRYEEIMMLSQAQVKVEEIVKKYDQAGAKSQLSNLNSLKEELEKALKSSNEACVASHQKLYEQVKDMKQFAMPKDIPQHVVQFIPAEPTEVKIPIGRIVENDVKEKRAKIDPTAPVLTAITPKQEQQYTPPNPSVCECCKQERAPLVGMYCLQNRCLERLCQKCRRMHDIVGHPFNMDRR